MTKNETTIARAKSRYHHSKDERWFYEIYANFLEHPENFDEIETQILDGWWESIPDQQQALWDYYDMRIKKLQNLIKNL